MYSDRAFADFIWIQDCSIQSELELYLGLYSARNTKWTRPTRRRTALSKFGPSRDTLHCRARTPAMGAALVFSPGPCTLWKHMNPVYLLCCESSACGLAATSSWVCLARPMCHCPVLHWLYLQTSASFVISCEWVVGCLLAAAARHMGVVTCGHMIVVFFDISLFEC